MDQQLEERLTFFEREELASPAIVHFVRDILLWLEQTTQQSCTEESVGTFASHLMLALDRVRQGEPLSSVWHPIVGEEAGVLKEQPLLRSSADYIQRQALAVLGLVLPPEEYDFLLLHLAAFVLRHESS